MSVEPSPLLDVSRETFAMLDRYVSLLEKWNPRINLVSNASTDQIWTRHVQDSLQLVRIAPDNVRHWVDLGSGGGFPGVVLAIHAKTNGLNTRFTLVESDKRKSAFLQNVTFDLKLNVDVRAERIEAMEPLGADCISARALASLDRLLEFVARHGAPNCSAIFPKGARYDEEIALALEHWTFSCEILPSETAQDSRILRIGDVRRA